MRLKMNSASAMMTRMMRIVHNMLGSLRGWWALSGSESAPPELHPLRSP
jgi:hypothetical protein